MTLVATLHRTLGRLLKPLMVICALALAIGPAADSIACGFEGVDAGSAQLLTEVPDDTAPADGMTDHAICAHGHCHHPAPLAAASDVPSAGVRYAEASDMPRSGPEPASVQPPSLKRPPRA